MSVVTPEEHAIRNALQCAAPGPWSSRPAMFGGGPYLYDAAGMPVAEILGREEDERMGNAAAILVMRNQLPALLGTARALREEVARLRELEDALLEHRAAEADLAMASVSDAAHRVERVRDTGRVLRERIARAREARAAASAGPAGGAG